MTLPAFAGAALDRADPERKDPEWVRARLSDPASRAVAASADAVLVDGDALLRLPPPADAAILLGLEGGRAVFGLDLADAPEQGELVSLRDAGARLSADEAGLAAYLVALLNWHRRHRFCANCGAATQVNEGGHSRHCPRCGATHFPRIDPVVIMLVQSGWRLLLGRQPRWPPGRYSALAGFVSPGETLEQAVAREVYEEARVVAREPRFIASQPWPFPASLMLGFLATSDGEEPVVGDGELEDVRWFDLDEVRAAVAGGDGVPFHAPPRIAIARFLIESWLEEASSVQGRGSHL